MTQPVVSAAAGDTRRSEITLQGQVYPLMPIKAIDVPAFVRAAGPLFGELAGIDLSDGERIRHLIGSHGEVMLEAARIASRLSQAVLKEIDAAELVQLICGVLEVNTDFFVHRLSPALGQLMLTFTSIADRVSSATSTDGAPT